MLRPRIIPCLLLEKSGLVKGVRFRKHAYIGDPINAVKILSEKEADEIVFLDIAATPEERIPDVSLVREIADESYVPFAFGGGIRSVESAKRILNAGAEKIVLSSAAVEDPSLISELASHFGSQSVVASIDYRNTFLSGPRVFARGGTRRTKRDPVEWAREVERRGAGEIIVNAIERDGTGKGFDLDTVRKVSGAVNVPVVALGGAGCTEDFIALFRETAASGGAAGRLFVYHGSPDSILINYPCREEKFRVFRESERIRSEKTS